MKFALCNEIFRHLPLTESFKLIADCGYTGVEIAPFTLSANPLDICEDDADRAKQAAADAGLEIVGMHWLMAETKGLHLTDRDEATRARTCEYLVRLTQLTARMGGKVMVLGSPQQRNLALGTIYEEAFARAVAICRAVCDVADTLGVTLAVEPLSPCETSFICSAREGRKFIAAVNRRSCRLHLDVKAMTHEMAGIAATISDHRWEMAHFHANDANLRGPGQGPTDFRMVFNVLADIQYDGWVAVEPFDYFPNPEACARISLKNMQAALPAGEAAPKLVPSSGLQSPTSAACISVALR